MGYCSLRVVDQPETEPVSLVDAKAHLRVDNDADDSLITALISVARSMAEQFLNRALITQTLLFTASPSAPIAPSPGALVNPIIFITPLSWPMFAGRPLPLPMAPVQLISSVVQTYYDGTTSTLVSGTDYYGDVTNEPARVTLINCGVPTSSDLAVTYVAGYGDAATAVPVQIVHAIKIMLAFLYERRGDDGGEMPAAAEALMWPFRMVTFG